MQTETCSSWQMKGKLGGWSFKQISVTDMEPRECLSTVHRWRKYRLHDYSHAPVSVRGAASLTGQWRPPIGYIRALLWMAQDLYDSKQWLLSYWQQSTIFTTHKAVEICFVWAASLYVP